MIKEFINECHIIKESGGVKLTEKNKKLAEDLFNIGLKHVALYKGVWAGEIDNPPDFGWLTAEAMFDNFADIINEWQVEGYLKFGVFDWLWYSLVLVDLASRLGGTNAQIDAYMNWFIETVYMVVLDERR